MQKIKKNQQALLSIANTDFGRKLLQLPMEGEIVEITPDHVTSYLGYENGKQIYLTDFRTHNKWQKLIRTNVQQIESYSKYLESRKNGISPLASIALSVMATTDTYFPTPSTQIDGYLYSGSQALWATARNNVSASSASSGDLSEEIVESTKVSVSNWVILRSAFVFNTASLPDTDAISSATLSLFGNGGATTNVDSTTIEAVSVTLASPSALATSDYNISNFGSTTGGSISIASWNTGAYNDITLNATGIANISKTGNTFFGLRTGLDLSNTQPTGGNLVTAYYSDQTGTTNDPKLVVIHAVPAAGPRKLTTLCAG